MGVSADVVAVVMLFGGLGVLEDELFFEVVAGVVFLGAGLAGMMSGFRG